MDRLEARRRVNEILSRSETLRDYTEWRESLVDQLMIVFDEAVEAALAGEHDEPLTALSDLANVDLREVL